MLVRSPHAHARIRRIDTATAAALPGVVAVFTGADMAADKVGPMAPLWAISHLRRQADGRTAALGAGARRGAPCRRGGRRSDRGNSGAGADAADLVEIDYEPLAAVVDGRNAIERSAPQLHDGAPGNVCFRFARGDEAAVQKAFDGAAHVVRLDLANNRLIGAAIEPRAVLADGSAGKLTLYCSTQVPHHIRRSVTEQLGLPQTAIRLIAPDVGGGFGYKGKHYPEETIVAWAARRLRRPVKWVATRSECFVSDYQGRGHQTRAELALDKDGNFLALRSTPSPTSAPMSRPSAPAFRARSTARCWPASTARRRSLCSRPACSPTRCRPTPIVAPDGRRPATCWSGSPTRQRGCSASTARKSVVAISCRSRRCPTRRRSARPMTAETFRRYFRGSPRSPVTTASPNARLKPRESRKRRGFGFACYVESSGVAPSRLAAALGARVGFFEAASIRVQHDGSVQALLGTHNHGQGHATTFAQILASRLGVPMASIEIIEGDTDQVPYGSGTFGSRSIAVGGSALDRAALKIIEKGKTIAAHLLEASAGDIAFADGMFAVAGTDRRVTLREVARVAHHPTSYPADLELGLQDSAVYDPTSFAWSNGAHACEVEVDCDTGVIDIVGYWGVDDVGTVINPMIVEGQIQGGIAQGLGQAIHERCVYDPASGQLLSGSFMDYAVPRAADMPAIVSELDESQPCTHNPLGAKGCGEAGSIGAPTAIVGAVLDALRPLGVTDLEMPLTPERVWQAIQAARRQV